jgi:thiosulfate/3-mercaptopyruvate sulfurtransferase
MLPRARELGAALAALGVRHGRAVVVYDSQGLFSAARAWYQLRAFGHPRVAVLEGGLPRWLAEGRPVATEAEDAAEEAALAGIEAAELGAPAPEVEEWALDEARVRGLAQVREAAAQRAQLAGAADALRGAELLLDARPAARFAGAEPEPRAGLRSGHVPGARSVPHSSVLDAARHNALLPRERLVEVFRSAGVDVARPGTLIASCGSGVTGCVLALALVQAGRPLERTALYDGSWAEYGAAAGAEAPLAVGAPEGDAETEALKK